MTYIKILGYKFWEQITDWGGVYLVTTRTALNQHKILYVGQADKVHNRVANPKHHARPCWNSNKQNGLYYWAYYGADGRGISYEETRKKIESAVIQHQNPPCNKQQ